MAKGEGPRTITSNKRADALESANHTPWQLAGMAVEAYQTNDPQRHQWADETLRYLRSVQTPDGAIADVSTTLMFLEAAHYQAATAFRDAAWEFPAEISANDGRAVAVLAWCRELPKNARLLDVGCGKGRYLKLIRMARPDLHLIGVDAFTKALSHVPDEFECRKGHLLCLPVETNEADAVLCVEALEHALLPVQAVVELCRSLCPGGQILVIDKDREYQADSQSQPWETWFYSADFERLLSPFCKDVICRDIRHGQRSRQSGLFLAACGTRHRETRAS
ncbi:MAG: class I SAM-dependent methyltransferase [Pirellulales bacterium]|nr:class I SAM-dependent methyltransferase [Pirellulales bacterium]